MGSYAELDIRLKKAHERLLRAQGEEAFKEQIARLPLTVCDEAVEAVARDNGWEDSFMVVSKANLPIQTTRLRPPVGNQEVPTMFRAQSHRVAVAAEAKAGGAPPAAALARPMVALAPLPGPPVIPPPRQNLTPVRSPAAVSKSPAASPPPMANLVTPERAPATVSKSPPPEPAAPAVPAPAEPVAEAVAAPPPAQGPAESEPEPAQGHAAHGNGHGDEPFCAICQDTLTGGEPVSVLDCAHVFHTQCVASWRRAANITVLRCPVCRHPQAQQPAEGDNDTEEWDLVQDLEVGQAGGSRLESDLAAQPIVADAPIL